MEDWGFRSQAQLQKKSHILHANVYNYNLIISSGLPMQKLAEMLTLQCVHSTLRNQR